RLRDEHLTALRRDDAGELRQERAAEAVRGNHHLARAELLELRRGDRATLDDLRSGRGRMPREPADPASWVDRRVARVQDRRAEEAPERGRQRVEPFDPEAVAAQRAELAFERFGLDPTLREAEAADAPARVARELLEPVERR